MAARLASFACYAKQPHRDRVWTTKALNHRDAARPGPSPCGHRRRRGRCRSEAVPNQPIEAARGAARNGWPLCICGVARALAGRGVPRMRSSNKTIATTIAKDAWHRDKGWERVTLSVELEIDGQAIIDRLAVQAYQNNSRTSSHMRGAVVMRAFRTTSA